MQTSKTERKKKKAGDWGKYVCQMERAFKLKRKTPTRHSHSHVSGQTVATQGLQTANAPSPCGAGLHPGQLEKGQDQSPVMKS